MKTNLKTLRLIKNQSGSIRIALKYQNQPDKYESFWVIGKDEIQYTIDRLTGKEPTRFIIDDLSYHLAFFTDGIRCHEMKSEKVIIHYVTFPGILLAEAMATLRDRAYQDDYKRESENVLTVDPETINAYAYEHRNRAKVIYHDIEPYGNQPGYSVKNAVIRLCKDDQTKDYFRRNLKSFIRQVGESRGILHLMLDSYSESAGKYPSFYFWLENETGQRIYNGGIINHKPNEPTPDYSIHT